MSGTKTTWVVFISSGWQEKGQLWGRASEGAAALPQVVSHGAEEGAGVAAAAISSESRGGTRRCESALPLGTPGWQLHSGLGLTGKVGLVEFRQEGHE